MCHFLWSSVRLCFRETNSGCYTIGQRERVVDRTFIVQEDLFLNQHS